MRRHELDLFSLVAGLLFVAVAVGFVVDEVVAGVQLDGPWVFPVLLVGIGVASLAGLVRGRDDGESRPTPDGDRTEIADHDA